jgi:transposase
VTRAARIVLSPEDLVVLREWVDASGTPMRVRDRARILLWSAAGHSDAEIAVGLRKDLATVALWRRRYLLHGLAGGLRDAPRPGRRPKHRSTLTDRILHAAYNEPPPRGARWSTRALARRFGVSHMAVQRIWQSQALGTQRTYRIPDRLAGAQLPFVDLLGVMLQPPTRVVIVGVDLTGESRVAYAEPILQTFRSEISGGHLLHSVRADPEDLVGLLDGFQFVGHSTSGRRHHLGSLLILLREIEERTSSTTRVHLLAEGRGAVRDPRLSAWLRLHPRFVLHDLAQGPEWAREVRNFLHQWQTASLRPGSFQGISLFTRAAARTAARGPGPAPGLVWSVGQSLDNPNVIRQARFPTFPPPRPSGSELAQSAPVDSPLEERPIREKLSLRTTGP